MRVKGPIRQKSSRRTKAAVRSNATVVGEPRTEQSVVQRTKSGGSKGYAGYEYQKLVTSWLSLELMIAKEVTETITVEPRSQEDIEAALRAPDEASLNVSAEPYKLTVQVKSRSTAPWTSSDFAKVLKGDRKSGKAAGRARPLDILNFDPQQRYLFATNESVEGSLRPHVAESVLDFPDVKGLPPHVRGGMSAATRASLSPRLAIYCGLTTEVLEHRIGRTLEIHCHVPAMNHPGCIAELQEAIRKRMLGDRGGCFRRGELLEILANHGGSVLPTRRMDHYVRPGSYEHIQESLEERHAVVIAGPSGTGKTLTADILEIAYRRRSVPYEVMGGENGPGPIRSRLANPNPVLFHLRDPWGSNRVTPAAEPWVNELPKLLTEANASHKFLVTSRSDVLQSAGAELEKKLAAYIVPIEIEDYGYDRLGEIYDRIGSDLSGHAAELARSHRRAALKELTRPYEIDRFLVALTAQDVKKPQQVGLILKQSQIEAISSVVADQVRGRGKDGVAAAAMLWAMLRARETVTNELLLRIGRLLRTVDAAARPDMEGMVDFLVAGRNLRREGETITFYHPRVEDGLRIAIEGQRNETEYLLSCLVDGLAVGDENDQDWGVETALRILQNARGLKAVTPSLSKKTHARLDKFLENSVLSVKKSVGADRAFGDLARYGSESHVPSAIARILLGGEDGDDEEEGNNWGFGRVWKAPRLAAHTVEKIRRFSKTAALLSVFIREVLPFSRVRYTDALVPLLYSLAEDLNSDFRNAVEIVAEPGGPSENLEAVVQGVCYGDEADFDWVIQLFVACEEKANRWWTKFEPTYRKAEEHVLDAVQADNVFDEPSDQFYNGREGLKTAAGMRFKKEGVSWLKAHKDRGFLTKRLAEFLRESKERVPAEALRILLECADSSARGAAWAAAERHWDDSLAGLLRENLVLTGMEDAGLRQALIRVAALSSKGLDKTLAELLPQMSPSRRLEILHDLMTTIERGTGDESEERSKRSRAESVAALLAGDERQLGLAIIDTLAGSKLTQVATTLSPGVLQELERRLLDAPMSTAGVLACLASAARLDVGSVTERLLRSGSLDEGMAAAQSLGMQSSVSPLLSALKHPCYQVRCEALRFLAKLLNEGERSVLLESAKDPSADVRLTWAVLMETHRWPEALPGLVELLKDQRNFSSDYGMGDGPIWSEFRVARAAAHALEVFENLPRAAVDALLGGATEPNGDPFVPCACLTALAQKNDTRITGVLVNSLGAGGLKRAPQYKPLAQAAAWALFDRAVEGKLNGEDIDLTFAAVKSHPSFGGPVLLAAACGNARSTETLLAKLEAENLRYRTELLRVAAATLRGTLLEGATERDRTLAALASGRPLQELTEERRALEMWSRSLGIGRDVQGYTSWLVKTAFGLPVKESIHDPRKFDLPKRIGILTMRSLTPARETGRRSPDDGY